MCLLNTTIALNECRNDRNIWLKPPSAAHQWDASSADGSPADQHRHHKRREGNTKFQREAQRSLNSSATRRNSKAVEMITHVEKLYDFGVSTGILPEDRSTKLLLRRMKSRFMSLLQNTQFEDVEGFASTRAENDSDDNYYSTMQHEFNSEQATVLYSG
ncbi:hypothetical protein DL546_007361 [Coniochaeta pulveracea]|uniref:Uncharacterized protein n=1 Tax=Coniochaeta pulveracea TaxID=177199 RepID=A0A420YIV9_9PEZI|nr:hypothetical protein DL546_007361 [Coniochaeta pulveracea]